MAIDLSRLRSGSPDSQLAVLRALKNEVIGHVQKKEQWVRAGALEPIVRLAAAASPAHVNGKATEQPQQQPCGAPRLSCDETVRLYALQLLASFANAGPAFLAPLDASGVLPAVLNSLCLRSERPQIVLAALRVLGGIADAAVYAPASSPTTTRSLADDIFTTDRLDSFARILAQEGPAREVASQVSIVTKLISILCRGEHHQSALVACGALDALATRLASFAVAEGHVIPYVEEDDALTGLLSFIPAPAPPGANLADVLSAIAAIIADSPSRACRLLYAPPIIAVFPNLNREWGLTSRRPSERVELAGLRPTKLKGYEPMDWLLLPHTSAQSRSQPTHNQAFPPLGPPSYRGNLDMDGRTISRFGANSSGWNPAAEASNTNSMNDADEPESPLIPWLIGQVRARNNHEALAAASVLTSLFKSGFAYRARESTLSLLVVPKLLEVLGEAGGKVIHSDAGSTNPTTQSAWDIIERTPAILARLVTDSELLQKAAFEAGAVKSMCKLLKGTYETLPPATETKFWSPSPGADHIPMDASSVSKLGDPGQHPLLVHRIRVRENSLRALGALGTFKEEYRKAIVDQDMIQYIKESLQQHPRRPGQSSDPPAALGGDVVTASELGDNPTPVIVAACYAIRMVSRSVNFLRTSLMDSGVAVPLHKLLRHPEIEVQIAATAAVCNLVTDFSPMREVLVTAGVLKVLCSHAKSENASLRLNALWALKHLVHSASTDLKKACLEELQSGWLVQLVRDDKEDEALHSAWTRSGHEQASEADDNMDIDDQSRSSYTKSWGERVPAESSLIRKADARLTALRDAECDPVRKARQDDLAIQEQGLGFIRNLIGGAHSNSSADSTNETTEMIDYLFNTLGQDRFFDILVGKLQVKVLHPFSGRRGPAGSEPRVLYPQAKIIEAVVYILVHLAASVPRHRQLVIAQTELLKQLVSLFNSQDREVRVALCHLINNLTWQDDVTDASACSQRAVELKKLGFLSKLESLGQNDDELDVRERARSALWQMKHGR